MDDNGEWIRPQMGREGSQNRRRLNCFQDINRQTTGKRPIRRPRHKWDHNIRMDLQEIDISMRNLIDSAQN